MKKELFIVLFLSFSLPFVSGFNNGVSAKSVESGETNLFPIEEENEVQPQWCMYQDTLKKSNKTLIKERLCGHCQGGVGTLAPLIQNQLQLQLLRQDQSA